MLRKPPAAHPHRIADHRWQRCRRLLRRSPARAGAASSSSSLSALRSGYLRWQHGNVHIVAAEVLPHARAQVSRGSGIGLQVADRRDGPRKAHGLRALPEERLQWWIEGGQSDALEQRSLSKDQLAAGDRGGGADCAPDDVVLDRPQKPRPRDLGRRHGRRRCHRWRGW